MTKFGMAVLFCVSLAGAVFAADTFSDISHRELADAVKAGKVTLLDCNNTLTYNKNHIPGALNYGKMKNELAKHLPADKTALIVAYCGDPDCSAYKGGATAAVEMGYTNVKFYSKGIVGWLRENEKVEGTAAK
ncbi:MAG: rhodanese-like domain-containing protein [Planctomycetota bacterium]